MKNINILCSVSALLLFSACKDNAPQTQRAQISIPVYVEEVTTGSLEKFTTTNGTLVPMASAEVSNKIEGIYRPVINPATGQYYKIGDKVKKNTVVARLEDDQYVNNLSIDTKKIKLDIARGDYEKNIALQKKGGATQNDVRNAEVSVASAEQTYDNAKISISEMSVVSPIDGVIVDMVYQTPGVEIKAGVTLFTVMNYAKMLLDVSLSESTMSYINIGLPVYVTHYSIPQDTVRAEINQVSPFIESETRTFKGVILVDNRDLKLKPGMFVKTDIVVDETEDAVIIPKEMIRRMNGRMFVYVADGTTAIQKEIRTGIENDTYVEVINGLEVGDKLIVDGYQTLKNKSKIAIQK